MSSSYAPCTNCGKLNRINIAESASKEPICGHCRASLPFHFGVAELNGAGLGTLVQKSPIPVVCDFWAPWCGPCKAFAPTFQEAAHRLAGRVAFAKLNTEEHTLAGGAYRVRSIPTLIYFEQGVEVKRMSGAVALDDFLSWLGEKN